MSRIRLASFLALLLFPGIARPDPVGPEEETFLREDVPDELQAQIVAAIAKGLTWMVADTERDLARAREQGEIPNFSSNQAVPGRAGDLGLRLLTLIKCGDASHRGLIENGLAFLRETHFQQEQFRWTYDVAVNLMVIQSYLHKFGGDRPAGENEEDLQWSARMAFWIASGCDEGHWTYGCPGYEYGAGGEDPYRVGRSGEDSEPGNAGRPPGRRSPFGSRRQPGRNRNRDRDREEEPADPAPADIRFERPPPVPTFKPANRGRFDNSNSQYAILGLKAATLLGIEFPQSIWEQVVDHWIMVQQPDGPGVDLSLRREDEVGTLSETGNRARGWAYKEIVRTIGDQDRESPSTYGMTVAGIAALCVAGSELTDRAKAARAEEALWDGWAWMMVNFRVDREGGYYLYGLERAGVFSQVRNIGEHDWYIEGATHLVGSQNESGTWGREGERYADTMHRDTAFSLLFLKRASSGFLRDYSVGPAR